MTLVAALAPEERFSSWHLVGRSGEISSRGAAGPALLRALGHPAIADAAARLPVERLYGFVADHRDVLGRWVPDGPPRRRFP